MPSTVRVADISGHELKPIQGTVGMRRLCKTGVVAANQWALISSYYS